MGENACKYDCKNNPSEIQQEEESELIIGGSPFVQTTTGNLWSNKEVNQMGHYKTVICQHFLKITYTVSKPMRIYGPVID